MAQTAHARSAPVRQPLFALDRVMLAVDQGIRALGYPGFETQFMLWLSGQLDVQPLRCALEQLSHRYPILHARLITPSSGLPYWEWNRDTSCELVELTLDGRGSQTVHDAAARLLSDRQDLSCRSPVRFYVIHAGGLHDVFLVQYNHVLVANRAALLVQRLTSARMSIDPRSADELFQLPGASERDAAGTPARREPRTDPILAYLRRYAHSQRRAGASYALSEWRHCIQGGTAKVRSTGHRNAGKSLAIIQRRLDQPKTRQLDDRSRRACGIPSLSMMILSSAFRAMVRATLPQPVRCRRLAAGIGIDLWPRKDTGPVVHNRVSLVPVWADVDETADRDALVQLLINRLRRQILRRADLGVARLAALFSRRPRMLCWSIDYLLHHGCSLWYTYFDPPDQLGDSFFGTSVLDACYAGPCWPPLGITLLVNRFRDHLGFQLTYMPELVSAQDAGAYLDYLLDDLG